MSTYRPTPGDRARAVVERFSVRNFVLAMVAGALVAAISAVVVLREAPVYESRAVLIIDNPLSLATAGDDGILLKLDRLRNKYATLAGTEAMTRPVAKAVGISPTAVAASTDVVPPPSSLAVVVVARAPKPARAVLLAGAMADEITTFVAKEHEANNVPPADRFVFRTVQPAAFAAKTTPTTKQARTAAEIAFGVALLLGYVALQVLRVPLPGPEPSTRRAAPTAPDV